MVVEPFARLCYWDLPDGSRRVRVTILMEPQIEGPNKMGIAVDGSWSMEDLFGEKSLAAGLPTSPNHVRRAAVQSTGPLLARMSADGRVALIYWATGPGGKDIQVLGDLTAAEAEKFDSGPPDHCGTDRQLLPALKYFTDGQQRKDLCNASWGLYVFYTSGPIEDLDAVKQYSTQLAKDIHAGRRNDLKLLIIGLGDQVHEDQLDELGYLVDDLETGIDVDLWDAKLVLGTKDEVMAWLFPEGHIFMDPVDAEGTILVPGDGIIKDDMGNVVANYRDTGLPGVLKFVLPPGAKSFSLEVLGRTVTQPLP